MRTLPGLKKKSAKRLINILLEIKLWIQQHLQLEPKPRGFHLITQQVEKALQAVKMPQVGLLHVFIQHSSASLTINENADPSVRVDFESFFNYSVAENLPFYTHTEER